MAWLDTVFKFIGLNRYNTITPALTNGQTCESQCDASGRLLVNVQSTNTVWSDTGAQAAEKLVKSGAGKVYRIEGRNTSGSTKYIFFFNALARPSNGSTGEIFFPFKVLAGDRFTLTLDRPRAFATGLFWSTSSTDSTFTYDSSGTFTISVEYE